MNSHKTYLLLGGYVGGNPGDEAILKSNLRYLNSRFPHSHFYIWVDRKSFQIKFDREFSCQFVYWKAMDWLFQEHLFFKLLIKFYTDFFPYSKKLFQTIIKPNLEFLEAVRHSDYVIFIGGGYLNGDYRLIQMNYIADALARSKKTFILLGQTLGPFKKKSHERMAEEIFNTAQKIVIREVYSESELDHFQNKVIRSVDDALGFLPNINEEVHQEVDLYLKPKENEKPLYLGINLRRCGNSRSYYPPLAKAVEAFLRKSADLKVKLFFIPMETGVASDDRLEGLEFCKYLPPPVSRVFVDKKISLDSKFYLINQMDIVIGMRLHSLVFSLSGGIPAIGIYNDEYYFRKISGILNAFEMPQNLLPLARAETLPDLLQNITRFYQDQRKKILSCKEWLLKERERVLEELFKE